MSERLSRVVLAALRGENHHTVLGNGTKTTVGQVVSAIIECEQMIDEMLLVLSALDGCNFITAEQGDLIGSVIAKARAHPRATASTPHQVCGHCNLWMKSSLCPRERNVEGRNYGPSMKDLACDQFETKARGEA